VALLIFAVAFGFVGVLLCGIGGMAAWNARTPADAIIISGQVVGFSSYRSKSRTMYSPRYRVTLPDGRTIETGAASNVSKSWKSPPEGTVVNLAYSPHDRELPVRELGLMRFLAPVILCGVGSVFGCIALSMGASYVMSLISAL
jgi:hypothetical protein